mmetsp:Transcript_40433/g.99878  ORF Transcript_40433/g.99878 Transcript_40433/m.99878 type:complete len:233 (+) Transcript_40433:290-988(+)
MLRVSSAVNCRLVAITGKSAWSSTASTPPFSIARSRTFLTYARALSATSRAADSPCARASDAAPAACACSSVAACCARAPSSAACKASSWPRSSVSRSSASDTSASACTNSARAPPVCSRDGARERRRSAVAPSSSIGVEPRRREAACARTSSARVTRSSDSSEATLARAATSASARSCSSCAVPKKEPSRPARRLREAASASHSCAENWSTVASGVKSAAASSESPAVSSR